MIIMMTDDDGSGSSELENIDHRNTCGNNNGDSHADEVPSNSMDRYQKAMKQWYR